MTGRLEVLAHLRQAPRRLRITARSDTSNVARARDVVIQRSSRAASERNAATVKHIRTDGTRREAGAHAGANERAPLALRARTIPATYTTQDAGHTTDQAAPLAMLTAQLAVPVHSCERTST